MKHAIAIVLLVVAALPLRAQSNAALAGEWTLAQNDAAGRGGRGGGIPGVPLATRMSIKVAPSEVVVNTNTGSAEQMQTAAYRLDGSEVDAPGPLGWTVKARAAWKDGTLVVNTVRSLDGPNGPLGAEIVDVYSVSGDMLTLVRTQGRNTQTLVYRRGK